MKLKTLKDIDLFYPHRDGGLSEVKEKIRAEAVKWIKEIKLRHSNVLQADNEKETKAYLRGQSQVLVEFFNITEEDLKSICWSSRSFSRSH